MMKYPKINTLFKRDKKTHDIIESEFTLPEFHNIRDWTITEKVDGMNIRIEYQQHESPYIYSSVKFAGRTDNAQIPGPLVAHLSEMFEPEQLASCFGITAKQVVLFGEGYGAKIQNGGSYRRDNSFILFDVWIDGWWLRRESIKDIADLLKIDHVPVIGTMTCKKAVEYVKSKPDSLISNDPKLMEGIVARSEPMMLFRNSTPVLWKLKARDYKQMR